MINDLNTIIKSFITFSKLHRESYTLSCTSHGESVFTFAHPAYHNCSQTIQKRLSLLDNPTLANTVRVQRAGRERVARREHRGNRGTGVICNSASSRCTQFFREHGNPRGRIRSEVGINSSNLRRTIYSLSHFLRLYFRRSIHIG